MSNEKVRARGRVVDSSGKGVTGKGFFYRGTSNTTGWAAIFPPDGLPAPAIKGEAADFSGSYASLVGPEHPDGAGYFDVPTGMLPGLYRIEVHVGDTITWAWPYVVLEAGVQNIPVVKIGGPDVVGPPVPGDYPVITKITDQFKKGTFVAAFSYYGLGGAPLDRIKRDLDRIRRAGFGHVRVWVDWERPTAASRIIDRKGALIPAQADKLTAALDFGASIGVTFDLTFETSHYDAVHGDGEGYNIGAHKNAVRNALQRWGKHPALKIVDLDNEAEVRGAGNHGSPDTGHTSPGRFAELMAVARSVPHTCLVSLSASSDGTAYRSDYTNGYLFRDVKGDILLPHFNRVKGWGANEGPKGKALSQNTKLPWYSQEPGRNGHSTQPGMWPVSEFENSFKSAKRDGALGICFHTDAAFDLTQKDAWDQFDSVEKVVVANVLSWIR